MTARESSEIAPQTDTDATYQEHPVVARLALRGSLGSQVRRGVLWSAASNGVTVAVQLGSTAVLSRLVAPEAFGLVALGIVINRLAALLSSIGLTAALVQNRSVTDRLLSTAFWFNAVVGVAVTGVLCAIAPLVSYLYDEPRLTPLLQISALGFALNIAAVPMALLTRALQIKRVAGFETVGTVIGLASTIGLALAGAGAIALVVGPLVQIVAVDVMAHAAVRWVPRSAPRRRELGQLWRTGRGVAGSNLLYFASRNLDTVLLGQVVSFHQVGLYTRSYNIMMLPLNQVSSVLSRVLMPAYARMQDDLPRLRRAWLTALRAALLFGLPTGVGAAATAPAFIETLFGPDWLGATTTLALLAASLPPQLIARNFGPVYQGMGRTGLQLRVALVTTLITIAGIVAGLHWGIVGVAASLLVTSAISMLVGLLPLVRMVESSVGELWRSVRGLLLAGAVLGGAAWGAGVLAAGLPAPLVLALQVVAGGLAYGLSLLVVDRPAVAPLLARLPGRGRRAAAPAHRRPTQEVPR